MNDAMLIEQFEQRQLSPDDFHHDTHIRLAWAYLNKYPLPEVLIKIREGIKIFAEYHNAPDLYHETITFAFVILIYERIASRQSLSWQEFKQENNDLFKWQPSILNHYYSEELLNSSAAKSRLVLPDLMDNNSTKNSISRKL